MDCKIILNTRFKHFSLCAFSHSYQNCE